MTLKIFLTVLEITFEKHAITGLKPLKIFLKKFREGTWKDIFRIVTNSKFSLKIYENPSKMTLQIFLRVLEITFEKHIITGLKAPEKISS